ncbi:acyltransferase family protein [Mixta intestinalis]|uniref:O-acetyltransferase OatA n=1 Tax=Mixta intestinalis TaxID=1615494 RepID=A0A6P1PZT9_9GAMM|nr:acyltransferase [Mixta intestinalis]QHM71105.1 O-acetyltransferase OatA [Mixta intestinalis]
MIVSVQVLRAVAALMVVMHHIAIKGEQYHNGALGFFHVGQFGVDLFFIISGYIMCYTTDGKKCNFGQFISRRFKRIIPLYWAITGVALIIYIIAPSMVNSSGGETSIISSWTLFPLGKKLLVNNGWTLSYEFAFYFIFAAGLMFNSAGKRILAVSLVLLCLVLLGFFFQPDNPSLKFITKFIMLEFILGMVAFYILKRMTLSRRVCFALLTLGILLLVIQNETGVYQSVAGRLVSGGVPMFFIFSGFVGLEDFFKSSAFWGKDLLILIGESSYSLYLVHAFTVAAGAVIAKKLHFAHHTWWFTLLLLSGSVIGGILCWRFVESPLNALFKAKGDKVPVKTAIAR